MRKMRVSGSYHLCGFLLLSRRGQSGQRVAPVRTTNIASATFNASGPSHFTQAIATCKLRGMVSMASFTDCMTISDAAVQLGVSRQRMHKIIERHRAKTVDVNGRLKMIPTDELQRIRTEREREQKR